MWGGQDQLNSEELCFIDSGIKSLRTVPLHTQIQVLNLHCNQITQIENLEGLRDLKHLDLSSNQIHDISGLDYLTNLRTLNLSCNVIHTVQGCENLRSLVKLNLSYNQIANISGLQAIDGAEYELSQLELHGNSLLSIDHVARCLEGAANLRRLVLSQGGADNPCCKHQGYRDTLLSKLPQLQLLDGVDRHGNAVGDHDLLADIPGLEQYKDYLLSNSSLDVGGIVTPKIDAAMEAFRQRGQLMSDVTLSTTSDAEPAAPQRTEKPQVKKTTKLSTSDMARLEKLENQMVNLMYSSREMTAESSTLEESVTQPVMDHPTGSRHRTDQTHHTAKRDIDDTEESEEDKTPSSAKNRTRPKKTGARPAAVKGSKVAGTGQRPDLKKQTANKKAPEKLVVRGRSTSPSAWRADERRGKKPVKTGGPVVTTLANDEEMRNNVEDTYVQIMHELEVERERRWKAEEASRKLVEHIKHLETKAREEVDHQDIAGQVTSRLKVALTNERETCIKLRTENDVLKTELEQVTDRLHEIQKSEEDTREALRVTQETGLSAEREQLRIQAHQAKRLQEATMKAAASTREVEILQSNVKSLKGQVHQMQELLAAREQEHRNELQGRHAMGSPEMQVVIQREIQRTEHYHSKQTDQLNQRITELTKDYENLEDEFRMALSIETNRFHELQSVFEKMSQESAHNKQALLAAQQKDEKSASVIAELTSLVKEQKGRISELSKAKQEQNHEHKERIQTLESHLEEARRRMVTLELLKQENVKLRAQLQAQQSLVEGLRAEKKVWGEELAHQESGLAQDRGRLQAKIESLISEVNTVKKQLDRETDAVRIKSKMIEDQTETIRKLKEGLQERDSDLKKARQETLKIQSDLEQQLSAELMANQELQEKLDRARERKEHLKSELTELEDKLEESKNAHSMLSRKWKEKSSLIGQLEQQVMAMKESWEMKEKRLTEERDKAVNAAGLAVDKLRSIDDAFRKQLNKKEENNQMAFDALEREKQEEIDIANRKVIEVENELRILLRENDTNKRAMEDRMKKLTRAFSELQHDLL